MTNEENAKLECVKDIPLWRLETIVAADQEERLLFAPLRKRNNPHYPPWHCFTACKCEKCGELYEADREHICKKKNSYPVGECEDENNE